MAMNKNIKAGDILFTFHTAHYSDRHHRTGKNKYTIAFKTLHVHNRRERTTGANVPRAFIPALNKLGIRVEDYGHDTVVAVGCRSMTYLRTDSSTPYPSADAVIRAGKTIADMLRSGLTQYEGILLMETDFVSDFREKKLSNKDCLFALQQPLESYLSNETYSE